MNIASNEARSKSIRTRALVAVAAFTLIATCGIGIAAFLGVLPASNGVAAAVTATPLIEMQVDPSLKVGRDGASSITSCGSSTSTSTPTGHPPPGISADSV